MLTPICVTLYAASCNVKRISMAARLSGCVWSCGMPNDSINWYTPHHLVWRRMVSESSLPQHFAACMYWKYNWASWFWISWIMFFLVIVSLFIRYYYYLIALPSYLLRGTCTYPLIAICFRHSGHPTSSIPAIAAWLLLNAGVPHRLPRPDWYAWAVSVHTLPLLPKMLNMFPNAFTFTFFILSLFNVRYGCAPPVLC